MRPESLSTLVFVALLSLVALALPARVAAQEAGVAFVGVDVRDVATRHYYNPFDGLMLDRNPYPPDLVDDAEALLETLAERGDGALGPVSSLRVMAWTAGELDLLAIGDAGGKPRYRRVTFRAGARTFADLRDVTLAGASVFISLKDLTLALRSADGNVAVVDPIGAGGYLDEARGVLMTPAMRGETTRTPGRAWMTQKRYAGTAHGAGYMIRARTHPEYYEGLPFVRLRRFDQGTDEYALHGPISRSGTFPLPPRLPGEKLATLKRLSPRSTSDPEKLADQLIEQGLIDADTRLVRGRISNGCIRLRARDIRELYTVLDGLAEGAAVTVSYAADPAGAAHPFPWETKRFAIATEERDEDGLTVMFTGEMKNRAGLGQERLPWPDDATLLELDQAADRPATAVLSGKRAPREWASLQAALKRAAVADRRMAKLE